jgi:hypothetical protein
MNHDKVVNEVKAQRDLIANATIEIDRLKTEAFEKIDAEKRTLKEQLNGLKVSKKEVKKA